MPQAKKKQKKSPAKSKAVAVKGASSLPIRKTVSRIKKVRALQQDVVEVPSSAVTKPEYKTVIKSSKAESSSRKGFLNSVCFQIGALFSDATALLESGKSE
ncbi:MAG: hypothetical protein HQL12_06170 [Candidatus Omnitrophica bacterium]|nr:hypothetical protein [Candidatus Omnitrophota bacterium]